MSVVLPGRPSAAALAVGQVRYALTDLWRARVVLVFSLLIPLVWLVFIGAVSGNQVVDPATGLRLMQFVTPVALAMGTLFATLPTVAITVTEAREVGVLKRLQGTPLPSWAYLTGRAVAASAFAVLSIAVALTVAVVAYGVDIIWRTAAATIVTLLVAAVCFVLLGLAISVLCRTSAVAQGASMGAVVAASFISGLFMPGAVLPGPVEAVADVLPVKPFAQALQDQFDPSREGSGWDAGTFGILLAWAAVGALVAAWGLRPHESSRGGRRAGHPEPVGGEMEDGPTPDPATPVPGGRTAPAVVTEVGRPGAWQMVLGQAGAALRSTSRDVGAIFFAVGVPVGLYAMTNIALQPPGDLVSVPWVVHSAAGMVAWGSAVTAFMNIPEAVAQARDRGVLKRLRGTPLPPAHYIAGRMVAGLVLAVLIMALVLALGALAFGLRTTAAGLFLALATLVLGTLTLGACGFLLAAAVGNARAFGAVALAVLLPVAFVSEVFGIPGPDWMAALGSALPLKHLHNAMAELLAGVADAQTLWHIAVLVGWGVAAGALAVRFFRWQPTG